MGRLIIPKTYVSEINRPLVFLAGPIINAPNWQEDAIELLFSRDPNLVVASPRFRVSDRVSPYLLEGQEGHFPRARAWERHYLDIASKTGAVLFWLPGEGERSMDKVYGAMTRVELGQWMTNYLHDNSIRLCIGSDGNFPELSPIRYDLSLDAPNKIIFSSLEDTCNEAVRLTPKGG